MCHSTGCPILESISKSFYLFLYPSMVMRHPISLSSFTLTHLHVLQDQLRSSVPRTKRKLRGNRAFAVAVPNCGTTCLCTSDRPPHCRFSNLFLQPTCSLWPEAYCVKKNAAQVKEYKEEHRPSST